MIVPQLLLTLSQSGTLQVELPGRNGHRQILSVTSIHQLEQLLIAQQQTIKEAKSPKSNYLDFTKIGQESFPTQQQFDHHNHFTFVESCPFCRALGAKRQPRHFSPGGQELEIIESFESLLQ